MIFTTLVITQTMQPADIFSLVAYIDLQRGVCFRSTDPITSSNRPGCKAVYNCLKIMNASGPGQSPGRGSGG